MTVEAYLQNAVEDHFFIPFQTKQNAPCCLNGTCHTFLDRLQKGFDKRFPGTGLDRKKLIEIYISKGVEGCNTLYFQSNEDFANKENKWEHIEATVSAVHRAALRHLKVDIDDEEIRRLALNDFNDGAQQLFLVLGKECIDEFFSPGMAINFVFLMIKMRVEAPLFDTTQEILTEYLKSKIKKELLA